MLFGAWDSAFLTSSWCCSPPGSVGLVPCRCSQRVVPRSSGAASPGTWWGHKFSCHQPTESERLGLEQRNLFYSKPSWNADSASMETKLFSSLTVSCSHSLTPSPALEMKAKTFHRSLQQHQCVDPG